MKRWRIPELLLGAMLAVGIFALGYSVSSARYQPSADGNNQQQQDVANLADVLSAIWGYLTKDAITLFTIVLTLSTIWMAVSTKGLWKETRRGSKLARQEFIASHRPRVIVRWIQPWDRDDGFDSVNVILVNVGESAAVITALGADLARRNTKTKDWEAPGISAGARALEEPIRLEGGEAYVWQARAKSKWGLADAFGSVEMCAVGVVIYRDDNGVARETGFFRVLDTANNRYVPTDSPEQEYAD